MENERRAVDVFDDESLRARTVGLSLVRLVVAFLVLKNMAFYFPLADDLFGANAIAPYFHYAGRMTQNHLWMLLYPFDQPFAPQIFLAVAFIVALCFLLGVGGRVTGVILFLLVIILKERNPFILDGSDNVIQVALPFLVLSDAYRYFRAIPLPAERPAAAEGPRTLRSSLLNLFAVGLMVQVCFVYFFTALAKLQGELWLNGTAVYYTMRVDEFRATAWNIPLTENHYFVVFATYGTILAELAFPFLVWFRKTKWYVFAVGVLLHLGIWIFMRIDNFSWIMIGTYFAFVTDREYHMLRDALSAFLKRRTLILLYDNWCPTCTRFAHTMMKLNRFGIVEMVGVRDVLPAMEREGLDPTQALERMAGYRKDGGTFFYGYHSLHELCKSNILLLPLVPVSFLLKITGMGSLLYDEFALKRKIIPLSCGGEQCRIDHLREEEKI